MGILYKLVTRDMGPHVRCAGTYVPPPARLPAPTPGCPGEPPELQGDQVGDRPRPGSGPVVRVPIRDSGLPVRRHVPGNGLHGRPCNGARIRFPPQKGWSVNAGLDMVRRHELRLHCAMLQASHAQPVTAA